MKPALVILAALSIASCSAVTSTKEYGLYRQAAVSAPIEERLAAAAAYKHDYPAGAFIDEVAFWYKRAELLYWRNKRGSAAGLTAYLQTLPAGPHHAEAEQRLADLDDTRVHGDALSRQARTTQARLERASAERARVRDEVAGWVARFLSPAVYRMRLARAPADIIVPWSLSLPAPRCTELFDPKRPSIVRRCVKNEELPYVVVGPKGSEAREASLELSVEEDSEGRPRSFKLAGPELFLRLEEATVVRRFDPKSSDHRVAGIARAVALVKNAFAGAVGDDPSCEGPAVAPVVLDLACHGMHATAVAGTEPGDDDFVTAYPE